MYMLLINVLLAVFNLLPAFPLDGGRVLRSILAQHMSYVKATRTAVTTGQVFAFILGITGTAAGRLALDHHRHLHLHGRRVRKAAGAEMKTMLSRLTVGQAVEAGSKSLAPGQTLSEVVAIVLHAFQEDFPVIEGDEIVGVLTRGQSHRRPA